MSAARFATLLAGGSFFESPRWHDGRLWLSDFFTHRVLALDAVGRTETMAVVAGQPSGLGWLPDGRLVVVSMLDRRLLVRDADGAVRVHADLSAIAGGPCNDLVVDAAGRAWVGNFGFDLAARAAPAPARLARVDADGSVRAAADRLWFPNGSAVTPDGTTLLVAETWGNRISAFTIGADGALGERRDWARFAPPPAPGSCREMARRLVVAPDGIALDADAALWVADAIGRRVLHVREGGEVLRQVSTAPLGCFACALGGDDGRTLFLCVAPDADERRRHAARDAQVWALRVDTPAARR